MVSKQTGIIYYKLDHTDWPTDRYPAAAALIKIQFDGRPVAQWLRCIPYNCNILSSIPAGELYCMSYHISLSPRFLPISVNYKNIEGGNDVE